MVNKCDVVGVEAVMNHKRKSTIKIILNHYRKILKYPFGFPFDKPDLNQRVGSRKDLGTY